MLSIIIPTYNESEIIEDTINKILKLKNIELIISDGGSTDNTIEKVKRLQNKYKNIKIIENKSRGKKGGDIEEGIKISSSKFCIFVDADLSCNALAILKIAKNLKKFDLIVGFRTLSERGFFRNFLTKSYSLVVNLLFSLKIKDYQCGLKGFRKEKILPILKKIENKDFFWDTELILISHKDNLKINDVSVPWREKRKSKIKIIEISLKFFVKLIKLRLYN